MVGLRKRSERKKQTEYWRAIRVENEVSIISTDRLGASYHTPRRLKQNQSVENGIIEDTASPSTHRGVPQGMGDTN
jgi:hypothetical protein